MRVVSLVPTATELVFALGKGRELVGVSDHCNWPEEPLESVTRVGAFLDEDVKVITDLEPDLVLVDGALQGPRIRALQARGIRVVDVSCVSLEKWPDVVRSLGDVLECQSRAGMMVRWGERLFRAWRNWSDGLSPARPQVVRVLAALPDGRAVVAGGDTIQGRLMVLAGMNNAFEDVDGYGVVSFDVSLEKRLDYLLLCNTPQGTSLLDDGSMAGSWGNFDIVRERRFLFVPCDLLCRYSQRMKECLEKLAAPFSGDFPRLSDWEEEVKR